MRPDRLFPDCHDARTPPDYTVEQVDHFTRLDRSRIASLPYGYHVAPEYAFGPFRTRPGRPQVALYEFGDQEVDAVLIVRPRGR